MAEEGMVVVHEETHEPDARIVAGFLQAMGIEAMILEDDAGDQLPSLEESQGVKVLVPAADAERARGLLADRGSQAETDSN